LIYRAAGHHVAGEKDDRHGGSARPGRSEVGHTLAQSFASATAANAANAIGAPGVRSMLTSFCHPLLLREPR
jgi:hypothetical protein